MKRLVLFGGLLVATNSAAWARAADDGTSFVYASAVKAKPGETVYLHFNPKGWKKVPLALDYFAYISLTKYASAKDTTGIEELVK